MQEKRSYLKQIALLGPTASGKTALSIKLAKKYNAIILSLDSLSIYKEIDIASAKPTLKERDGVVHFGIDCIRVDEPFNVTLFFELYKEALEFAKVHSQNLIIVGGTGFYLKSMLEGLSEKPEISLHVKEQIEQMLVDLPTVYKLILEKDSDYASKISSNDSYRMEKWLEIYLSSGRSATEYFTQNSKEPLIEHLELFEIDLDRDLLRERIALRTKIMLESGLIDEVFALEKKYTRAPNALSAIGLKESFEYLDGYYDLKMLEEKIITNTARLAKRQRTFNASQFPLHVKGDVPYLEEKISAYFEAI